MKEITLETKIADLLNDYENMKDILIGINPKFKKLNNPILRRTIGKVAGVRQAAIVGGMKPMVLLNLLRRLVGQDVIEDYEEHGSSQRVESAPEWASSKPLHSVDANRLLDDDKNPLAETQKILKSMSTGEVMSISADFQPEPLIEEFIKKGHDVYTQKLSDSKFVTYVQKG